MICSPQPRHPSREVRPRRWAALWSGLIALALLAACERLPLHLEGPAPQKATPRVAGSEVLIPSQDASADQIVAAMGAELGRSRRELRRRDYPAPYFLAYRIRDQAQYQMSAAYGAITTDQLTRHRAVYAEVRVGDYQFDNRGGQWSYQEYGPVWEDFSLLAPLENLPAPIRRIFWLLSDAAYKGAIENYLRRRAEAVQKAEARKAPSFARAKPLRRRAPLAALSFDRVGWSERLRRLSAILAQSQDVIDSRAQLYVVRSDRFFLNTEGTEVVDGQLVFGLQLTGFTRAPDGEPLQIGRSWAAPMEAGLPGQEELEQEARAVTKELLALRQSEALTPYTGPAVLSPDATGVFFHEAVGHRLEGERQEDEHSGQTFRDSVGEEIIPAFLSVYDDPTLEREGEVALSGAYVADDEGVPSEPVTLVENGTLKSFLLSRAPLEGFASSNGHGRSDAFQAPMARMGSLIVRSKKTATEEELIEALRAEARRQGLSFGLYIQDVDSGETNTSRYGVQAFRGMPRRVWKVDTETGARSLVRGVEIIGTPLASIRKILLTGADYRVFNGYCGAESGLVPVSTVAPSALLQEIETQRKTDPPRAGPILAPPPVPPLPSLGEGLPPP